MADNTGAPNREGPPEDIRPTQGEPTVVLAGSTQPYGGFWWRVLAGLIDSLILLVPLVVIVVTLNPDLMVMPDLQNQAGFEETEIMKPMSPISSFLLMALYMLYFGGCESSPMQASPGKRLVGLRVTDTYGRQLSVGSAVFRAWPWWLASACGVIDGLTGTPLLGFLAGLLFLIAAISVAFNGRKQGIHDIFAGCLVTKRGAIFGY